MMSCGNSEKAVLEFRQDTGAKPLRGKSLKENMDGSILRVKCPLQNTT